MIRKIWAKPKTKGVRSTNKPTYQPGVLIVKWKSDALPTSMRGIRSAVLPANLSSPLQYLRENCGLREVVNIGSTSPAPRSTRGVQSMSMASAMLKESFGESKSYTRGLTVLKLDPTKEGKALKALKDRSVLYAEPAPNRWIAARPADPRFNLQWGLPAIGWTNLEKPDASSINVAVLDTGVDMQHPDLINSVKAYNHFNQSATDLVGHGTHVAGIIGAGINNNVGISGVANCNLHCWKVFSDAGSGEEFDNAAYYQALGQIIDSAGKDQIKVVNLSLGGTALDRTERELLQQVMAKNIIVVAAMGNEYEVGNPIEYPAKIKGVIAVGAIGEDLARASFSNTGRHIAIVAPGVSILSTVPRQRSRIRPETMYTSWNGTSMATPMVSGSIALIWAKHPNLTSAQVIDRLINHTTRLPGMGNRQRTSEFGTGLVNLQSAFI